MLINPYRYGGASFLDQLSVTPRACIALKKLISTATNSLRVRRSSDSTEQDIGFTGNALDTSALTTFVGANSGFLRTFYDQTGNGEDAQQATAGNQPRIVNSGTPDSMAIFDGTSDSMAITSLSQGAAQVGIYMRLKMPSGVGVKIIMEQSVNYNNATQSYVVYYDSSTAGVLNIASRNTLGAGDFRLQHFPVPANTVSSLSILLDRGLTGTDEIKVWRDGVSQTPTAVGSPAGLTGVYSAYDTYLGARAGTSLYADVNYESIVVYNADTLAIRSQIEAIVG